MRSQFNSLSVSAIVAAMMASNNARVGHKRQPKGTQPKPAGTGKKRRTFYCQKRKQ